MFLKYFRALFGSDHGQFVTLVAVKRTGNKREYAPAEWIWSDLFYWISYDFAHQRCLNWYERQPIPNTYTGRKYVFHLALQCFLNVNFEPVLPTNPESKSPGFLQDNSRRFW